MKKLEVSLRPYDKYSVIDVDGIHDAEIYGVELDPPYHPKNIILKIAGSEERFWQLKCFNFQGYQVLGMHHQNVIFDIEIYEKVDPTYIMNSYNIEGAKRTPEELADKVKSGELLLIHVRSSFGAEIHIFCESFELFSESI